MQQQQRALNARVTKHGGIIGNIDKA